MARQRDVTFYLVKEDVADFDGVLPPREGTSTFVLGPDVGLDFEGRLVVKTPREVPPWWVPWLRETIPNIGQLMNASNAAAIVLQTGGRLFAIALGYGRGLMALDSFERDFGLRVALNVVDPDSLRSVDAKTFEQLTVTKRSQTSRAAHFDNFRLSRVEDILKAVTGTPTTPGFASRVTGADAIKITYVPTLAGLRVKCDELLAAYQAVAYRQNLAFIDDLRTIRDRSRINELNDRLVQDISQGHLDVIHMAPPEITDVRDIDQFAFGEFPDEPILDLDIEWYRNRILADDGNFSLERLRKTDVGVTYRGGVEVQSIWSVYDCIVAEIRVGPRLYVLSGGTWYQVEGDFAERIAVKAEAWSRPVEFLPVAQENEPEPTYNERVASAGTFQLFDECLARPAGARSPIEFCDLLDANRRVVHVKRRSRSSTLSHLFAQGVISAETFVRDATFRIALTARLQELGRDAAVALIPADRPEPRDWEIVFAIVGTAAGEGPRSLPFFSQLNFTIAAERLDMLGFHVSLRLVPSAA